MSRKIIAISNQKGGVGKTATAINLSASLAELGKNVLLIDMDPQGNSSRGLGVDISLLSECVLDVLDGNVNINKLIKNTVIENLHVICSNLKLASLDSLATNIENPYFLLKKYLNELEGNYDYVIIDCPPSLGILNINALIAADSVLVPVQCEYFAMEGVAQILASISRIQNKYNKDLRIEGFLFTMYDSRTRLGTEVTTQIRGLFKENTFLTTIPRSVAIPESNAAGVPCITWKPRSNGAQAYLSLAKEVIANEKK